jgi:hypothetical protein
MLLNRFIRTLALLLAFILVVPMVSAEDRECAVEGECADPNAVVIDPNCPDRDHVVRCAGKYLDKNQNGFLERSELQGVIDELPWYVFYSLLDLKTQRSKSVDLKRTMWGRLDGFSIIVMLHVLHFC